MIISKLHKVVRLTSIVNVLKLFLKCSTKLVAQATREEEEAMATVVDLEEVATKVAAEEMEVIVVEIEEDTAVEETEAMATRKMTEMTMASTTMELELPMVEETGRVALAGPRT